MGTARAALALHGLVLILAQALGEGAAQAGATSPFWRLLGWSEEAERATAQAPATAEQVPYGVAASAASPPVVWHAPAPFPGAALRGAPAPSPGALFRGAAPKASASLTASVMAGETTVYICSRCASELFAVGDSIRLSGSGNSESRRVAALGSADSGKIVLDSPLASGYPVGSSVFNQASNSITAPCPPECPQDECDCDRGLFYKAVQQATEEEFDEIQNESAYQAQAWMRKLRDVSQSHIRQGDEVLAQVGQRQINITLEAAVEQRQAELAAVDQMNQSVEEARLRMMPIAVNNSVRGWAVKHSKNLAAGMLDPVLEGAIQDMKHVNDVRARASENLERAQLLEGNLTTLSQAIVQLKPTVSSWISGFLVNYSSEVSVTVQQLITMNNDSEQLAQLVYQTAFEAKDMAQNELNGAKAAEASAMEALARARSNTERIARLKTRMEKLMQGQQAAQPTADE